MISATSSAPKTSTPTRRRGFAAFTTCSSGRAAARPAAGARAHARGGRGRDRPVPAAAAAALGGRGARRSDGHGARVRRRLPLRPLEGGPSAFAVKQVVPMRGTSATPRPDPDLLARSGRQLADGTRGDRPAEAAAARRLLRAVADEGAQAGRAVRRFRVHGDKTTVRFTVPYDATSIDGWVVTAQPRGTPRPAPSCSPPSSGKP